MRSVDCSERCYLKLDHPVAMLSDSHIDAPSHVAQRPANTAREVYRELKQKKLIYLTVSSRIATENPDMVGSWLPCGTLQPLPNFPARNL